MYGLLESEIHLSENLESEVAKKSKYREIAFKVFKWSPQLRILQIKNYVLIYLR